MKDTKKHNDEKINLLSKKVDFKIYELLILIILIIIVSAFLSYVLTKTLSSSVKGSSIFSNKDYNVEEFSEVYDLINDSYYKKVDKKKLINGAINGMLESLGDPHTSYFNESQTENFNEIMNGSYEGIGAEISVDGNGNVIIVSVFKNSPASEVGLKFGDIIKEVNGKNVKGMNTTEVVTLIKDPSSKTATLKIQRDGKELELKLTKREIVIESVESKIYESANKKIGYVVINTFANNTYEQFKENIEELESKNIDGLIIDVRGNSGGYLHSVTSMLDMFLPKGTISYQIQDKKTVTKYKSNTSESRNYPIAVLVNKSSASASEILAIGLKESYNADVIGTNTYGKGTVQVTKNLKSGGMIKYTIQKWLSPKGNWINEVGVEPTVKEELDKKYEENPSEDNDNQLQRAIDVVSNKK